MQYFLLFFITLICTSISITAVLMFIMVKQCYSNYCTDALHTILRIRNLEDVNNDHNENITRLTAELHFVKSDYIRCVKAGEKHIRQKAITNNSIAIHLGKFSNELRYKRFLNEIGAEYYIQNTFLTNCIRKYFPELIDN